jgi:hypothetical protein
LLLPTVAGTFIIDVSQPSQSLNHDNCAHCNHRTTVKKIGLKPLDTPHCAALHDVAFDGFSCRMTTWARLAKQACIAG